MRIILASGEEYSSCLVKHLKMAGHQIVGMVFPTNIHFNQRKRSLQQLWFNVKYGKLPNVCHHNKIEYRVEINLHDGSLLSWIKELSADLLLVLSWPRHIPKSFLSLFKYGGMNIHPSTLPKLRGSDPIFSAILNDQPGYGISFHRMENKMDSGNIYLQKPMSRDSLDSYERLYFHFMREAGRLAPVALEQLLYRPEGRPQTGESTFAEPFGPKHSIYSCEDTALWVLRKSLACQSHHKMKALCGKTLFRFNTCSLQAEQGRIEWREPTVLSVGFRSILIGHGSRKLKLSGVTTASKHNWKPQPPLFLIIKKGQKLASEKHILLFLKGLRGNHP